MALAEFCTRCVPATRWRARPTATRTIAAAASSSAIAKVWLLDFGREAGGNFGIGFAGAFADVFGVVLGVVLGIAPGIAPGIAFGIVLGIAPGLASGVAGTAVARIAVVGMRAGVVRGGAVTVGAEGATGDIGAMALVRTGSAAAMPDAADRARGAVPCTMARSSASPAIRSAGVCLMASIVANNSSVVANRLSGSFSSMRSTATVSAAGVSDRMSVQSGTGVNQ